MASPAQGPRAHRGQGGRGPRHRPQGPLQGGPVRRAGPQHQGVDGRAVHAHPAQDYRQCARRVGQAPVDHI